MIVKALVNTDATLLTMPALSVFASPAGTSGTTIREPSPVERSAAAQRRWAARRTSVCDQPAPEVRLEPLRAGAAAGPGWSGQQPEASGQQPEASGQKSREVRGASRARRHLSPADEFAYEVARLAVRLAAPHG